MAHYWIKKNHTMVERKVRHLRVINFIIYMYMYMYTLSLILDFSLRPQLRVDWYIILRPLSLPLSPQWISDSISGVVYNNIIEIII